MKGQRREIDDTPLTWNAYTNLFPVISGYIGMKSQRPGQVIARNRISEMPEIIFRKHPTLP